MQIVAGRPADAEDLAAFARQTFLDAYGGSDPTEHVLKHVDEAFTDTAINHDLRDPDTSILLAKSGERSDNSPAVAPRIVGYVTLRRQRPIDAIADPAPVQLERIYVDQHQHGAGIGSELIRAAIATAASQGAATLWLSVWQENLRAQAFYRRNGFDNVGETFFMMGPVREDDFIFAHRIRHDT